MKHESQRVLARVLAQSLPAEALAQVDAAGAALPNAGTSKTILTGDVIIQQHSDGIALDGGWSRGIDRME